MVGNGPSILVKRGAIEGHVRPPGGEFGAHALLPRRLTFLTAPFLGVHCVDTHERVLALTYDDGPHPEHTPAILDVLREHGVHATFFVLTEPARRHPEIIRRARDEGHEIALHGGDHTSLLTRSTREAVASVSRARAELEEIAGAPVTMYRPPYGQHTPQQARALRRLGLELVLWSSEGLDWIDMPVERVIDRLADGAFPGAILLMHDDRADPETLQPGEALPTFDKAEVARRLLSRVAEADLTVAPLPRLLADYPHVLSASRLRMRFR